MSLTRISIAVLLILITKGDVVKDLQWCLVGRSMKEYGPDQFCCGKMLLNEVDNYGRKRGCCSNTIYYTEIQDCIEGKLESLTPPESLTAALAETMAETTTHTEMKDMVKEICEDVFVYKLKKHKKTNKTGQHIRRRRPVQILNMQRLKKTGKVKWRTLKQTRINMDKSLNRKYKGKTIFVYSHKNLLEGKSLNLFLGDILIEEKLIMKHMKRCIAI